ncbi:bacteriocin-type signal sequence [Desulfovibrio sp. ZJ369]|uniref:bacteriocin-type signal sequence n=1 Tax=Desulfovibrio sp. ZJ369 TaxID=2709793 RepID=UPI0013EC8F93|nr:bacteriocin-type signal sequence [Desulfovibrio sp. ZJ369]
MSEDSKEVKFHEEVQKMEYEPLDKTEMKLIHWSWGLGVGLLVVLWLVSQLIPGAHV